jgi:tetratricopeptide (TPR) repeat protein
MPNHARVHYNLGLLLQSQGQLPEAEIYLLQALKLEPDNMDYLYALASHYLKRNWPVKAEAIARKMIECQPDQRLGQDLLMLLQHGRDNSIY